MCNALQVGVLTMAGKTPRVLVTPTQDLGKVLNSMHDMALEGEPKLASAVQIAQLALKHRQNKNQRQRIVLFVGSPITETKVWELSCGVHLPSHMGSAANTVMHIALAAVGCCGMLWDAA